LETVPFPDQSTFFAHRVLHDCDCEETKGRNPHFFKDGFLGDLSRLSHPTYANNFENILSLLFSEVKAQNNSKDRVLNTAKYFLIKKYIQNGARS